MHPAFSLFSPKKRQLINYAQNPSASDRDFYVVSSRRCEQHKAAAAFLVAVPRKAYNVVKKLLDGDATGSTTSAHPNRGSLSKLLRAVYDSKSVSICSARTQHWFSWQGTRVLLAFLSVILSLLALPGSDWPLVVLISLVPLGLALNNASRTESFLYGFGSGFGGWLGATSGLIAGLSEFAQVSLAKSAIVVGLVCAWMALPYGAFGFLWASCRWMDRRYAALKRAACLTLLVS